MIPVIDIFAGPGGLGEGFSSLLDKRQSPVFKIRLSIEKEEHAHRTLLLRAFFRQFRKGKVPNEYYEVLRGEREGASLYDAYPREAAQAKKEAIQATLGPDSWGVISEKIRHALNGTKSWVLIGGPPCQAYSLVGRARNKNKKGYKPGDDPKHFLYKEYLRILSTFWPPVFVMENVKGLLSSHPEPKKDPIFRQIIADLTAPAKSECFSDKTGRHKHTYRLYSLSPKRTGSEPSDREFVLRAEEHGVPQARHRVIIVGVRNDIAGIPAALKLQDQVPITKVLKHLPRLRSGISGKKDGGEEWSQLFHEAAKKPWFKSMDSSESDGISRIAKSTLVSFNLPRAGRGSEFVNWTPKIDYREDWYLDSRLLGVCNHTARSHIGQDIYRYFYAACFAKINGASPNLNDFPADLLPNHRNVADAILEGNKFLDRFRVQPWGRPATTITSHISKDGHYYIHPDPSQARSFTVREAARVQSFPDNYFFTGPRTAQYTQVGNAVPPLLARAIAESIAKLFNVNDGDA